MSHIVIDARRINSSTGYYAKNLLEQLEHTDSIHNYTVIVLQRELTHYQPVAKNFRVVASTADHYTLSEQLRFAWQLYRLRPDLVHFTMPQQPLLWFGARITTIHDTTLIRFENLDQNKYLYRLRKLIFTLLMRNVIWRSRYIISPSKYVTRDLDTWTNHRHTSKLKTIYNAGDTTHVTVKAINELKNVPYLCWVGNAFPYKNITTIITAFAAIKKLHPSLHLALAGRSDIFYERLADMVRKKAIPDVHFLGYINDAEKRWLFQNANAYVVASLSEGFHMPLLEAMAERCPIISSNATCLPEIAGTAALYFDPRSVDELVAAIQQLLEDSSLRGTLVEHGTHQLQRFSWHTTAAKMHGLYLKALTYRA